MYPELHFGPLTLQTFGLMFALAFLVSGWVVAKRLGEYGWPGEWAYELVLAGAVGGLFGAKLWFSVQQGEWSLGQIFSGTGLVWYGGALGGAATVALYSKWRGILNMRMLDAAAPALAIGYAVGRIGCQISGDGDYGKPSHAWWAMGYPHGTVPTPPGVTVYPTPIIETVVMALFALFLWRQRDRWRPGVLFAIYLIGAGIERFAIEFIRRNDDAFAGLTVAQLTSVALAAAGAGLLTWLVSQRARPVPVPGG